MQPHLPENSVHFIVNVSRKMFVKELRRPSLRNYSRDSSPSDEDGREGNAWSIFRVWRRGIQGMQGHIPTRRRRRRRRLRFLSLDFQKRAWSRKGKIHGLTHFNHFCGEKHRGGNTFGRSWLCKMRGVQVCQRLLPARKKNAPGLCWAGHRRSSLSFYIERTYL